MRPLASFYLRKATLLKSSLSVYYSSFSPVHLIIVANIKQDDFMFADQQGYVDYKLKTTRMQVMS